MYNKELFEQMLTEFGSEKMILFSEMMVFRYSVICKETSTNKFFNHECEFEHDWWKEKLTTLKKQITQ